MPESSDLSLMTDRVGKGWFSMLCHRSELIGSGITPLRPLLAGADGGCAAPRLPGPLEGLARPVNRSQWVWSVALRFRPLGGGQQACRDHDAGPAPPLHGPVTA